MANKKRRKPGNRPRTPQGPRTTVRTSEVAEDETAMAPERRGDGPGPNPGRRPESSAAAQRSRADKKELARRQREQVRRIIRRRQRIRQGVILTAIVVGVGVGIFLFTRPEGPAAPTGSLPGLLRTQAPWDANADQAAARADAINLPSHGSTLAMHEHADVQIFAHGVQQQIPIDVGIDTASGDVESIHTHSSDGVVHVESSTVAEFTLQEFFDVWGVRFTNSCLGAYCSGSEGQLQVFVDGQEFTGDLSTVPLDDQTVIVVSYGTPDELPDPIPSTFDFASVAP